MQKIINGIAIFSGAVALGIVGLGGYVFIRKDAIIEDVKGKIMESVLPGGIGDLGASGLSGALDIPDITNPMAAPDESTSIAPPAGPNLPLCFYKK